MTMKGGAASPEEVMQRSNAAQKARLRRTLWLFSTTRRERTDTPAIPSTFVSQMDHEIKRLEKWGKDNGYAVALRMNGTSDLRWESMPYMARKNIMAQYPHLIFYDYTKYPPNTRKNIPKNYHLTFSYSDSKFAKARMEGWYRRKVNAAVVFHPRLPSKMFGKNVIDGLDVDLRFLDPNNIIVGLKAKGWAKQDTTGFVVRTDRENPDIELGPGSFDGDDLFPDM